MLMCYTDVRVGDRVTIGCGSHSMPGSTIEQGATLGNLTLVMKGEVVPAGSAWVGVPAVPCSRNQLAGMGPKKDLN